jgi:hypothetical protein
MNESEKFVGNLSQMFPTDIEAGFKLSLIFVSGIGAFQYNGRNVKTDKVMNHTRRIAEISSVFAEVYRDGDALDILADTYAKASSECSSQLVKYLIGRLDLDPVDSLGKRIGRYLSKEERLPGMKALEIAAEDEFIEDELPRSSYLSSSQRTLAKYHHRFL